MLPTLIDVGVTPTSLAVFGPDALPPPAAAPAGPAAPPDPPVAPVPAVPLLAVPPVASCPPTTPPVALPSVLCASMGAPCSELAPRWALTNALFGRRVPHACSTSAAMGSRRSTLCLRMASASGRVRKDRFAHHSVTPARQRATCGRPVRLPLLAPLAQWQSNGLLIRRFRVRIPGGALRRKSILASWAWLCDA